MKKVDTYGEIERLTALSFHQGHLYIADGREGLHAINIDSGLKVEQKDHDPLGPSVEDVYALDDYVYLASCERGVQVVERKKEKEIHPHKFFKDGAGCAVGLDVIAETLLVAYQGAGVRVYDLSEDKVSPKFEGAVDVPGSAKDVMAMGDYAYVASGGKGLRILNWKKMEKVGGTDLGGGDALGVSISGDYAYVASGDGGLKIVDIANPEKPDLVSTVDVPIYAWEIFVHSVSYSSTEGAVTLAFVVGGKGSNSGLWVIDVTDPQKPEQVGLLKRSKPILDVVVNGDRAYLSQENSGLLILDISDPTNPKELTIESEEGNYSRLMYRDGFVYLGRKRQGFQILSVEEDELKVLDEFQSQLILEDVDVVDERIYGVDGSDGMWVYNIGNPEKAFVEDSYDTPGTPHAITVIDKKAYIADGGKGLHVVNTEDVSREGSFKALKDARDVVVKGNNVFVLDWEEGFVAFDGSNLDEIEKFDVFEIAARAHDVTIAGWYAYLAEGDAGVQAVRIETASKMSEGEIETAWTLKDSQRVLALEEQGRLCVADGAYGLKVFDISAPLKPEQIFPRGQDQSNRDEEDIIDIAIVEEYLVALDSASELRLFENVKSGEIHEVNLNGGNIGGEVRRIATIDYSSTRQDFYVIALKQGGGLIFYHIFEALLLGDRVGFYETPGRASVRDVSSALWKTAKSTNKKMTGRADKLSYSEIPGALVEVTKEKWSEFVYWRVEKALILAGLGGSVFVVMMLTGMALTAGTLLPVRANVYTWWEVFFRLRRYLAGGHGPVVFAEEGKKDLRSNGFGETGPSFVRVDACSAAVLEQRPFVPRGLRRWLRVLSGRHPREGLRSRVVGSGITFTSFGEKVAGVTDLRKQIRLRLEVKARTRDGIEVKNNVFSLVTLGQAPDAIKVTYIGEQEKPENLRVLKLKLHQPNDVAVNPYQVQVVDKLEDVLDSEDQHEIHRYVQAYRAGAIDEDEPGDDDGGASGWRPFDLDERRVFAALQSKPFDVDEEKIKDWTEIAAHQAVEIYRNEIAKETFDNLYAPENPTEFPLLRLKDQVRVKAQHQGILAFEYVEKKDGISFMPGEQWLPQEVEIFPVRELQARKVLRSRGMKVLTVGVTDLYPSLKTVREHYLFENWRASWQQDAMITTADHDLQAMRVKNKAREQAQRDLAFTLKRILEMEGLDRDALAVRVYQALERVSADPETRKLLPRDAIYTMRVLKSLLLPD